MKKGLTRAGLGNVKSVQDFIRYASMYGFEAVDVGASDVFELVESHGVDGANEVLLRVGVEIGSLSLPVEWRAGEDEFRRGLGEFPRIAEVASKLGCTACCTYALPSTDANPAHFMAVATRRLRVCAEVLDAYGIRLGIEFVGPHHLRTRWKNPFIWDLDSTLDWISAINKSNVGLLLDTIHWYTTGGSIEDISKLDASQIVHVHVNDAPAVPVPEVMDNDRLLPGDGVIDLVSFLRALRDTGYSGVVAQEVLTPEPPKESVDVLLSKSQKAFEKLFSTVGI
jgi:sugar phosphate isomerase/epimerase